MTPEEIKSVPVFWSLRRRRYWNRCRLKYFLHYYISVLGRRDDADPLCKKIHELDRRITPQAVVRIMFCNALHDLFAQKMEGSVAAEAEALFRKTVWRMINYPESSRYIVPEILTGGMEMVEHIAREIRQAGEKINTNFWNSVQKIPLSQRRQVERPQRVSFLELSCYFVPVLTFIHHGEIWILESSAVNEEGDLLSCLHRMWVSNDLGRDPTRVRSLYLNDDYELCQLDSLPSASAALKSIKKDLDDMIAAEMDGYVSFHDFPPSPGEGCSFCQFRSCCQENGSRQDIG